MRIIVYYFLLFAVEMTIAVPVWLTGAGLRNRARNLPFWNEWRFHLLVITLVVAISVLLDMAKAHGLLNWLVGLPVTREK